jgi:hypothetical protein
MTHANHRRGSRESLNSDYVILVRGPVKENPEKARRAVEILAEHNPVGVIKRRTGEPLRYMRNWKEGLGLKELLDDPDPCIYLAGVYDKTKDVGELVKQLSEEELGFSVVVSGIFENTIDLCKKAGFNPHTANLSMETIGRTELLPEDRILELMTMCGHGLVGEPLSKHLINRVRKGKMTAEDAGLELGKQCVCNFYNPVRAAKIIEEYTTAQR